MAGALLNVRDSELQADSAHCGGTGHGIAGVDLILLGEEVFTVGPDGEAVEDTEGGSEVPKDKVLGTGIGAGGCVESLDVLDA